MKELTELFDARRRAPEVPYAVATVLRVQGSSYRRPGARMLVDIHGRVAGSVSGGCLERNVIAEAKSAILDHKVRLLSFDTTDQDDLAFGSSLGCLGKIGISIEVLPAREPWPLEDLVERIREQRQPAAFVTRVLVDEGSIRLKTTCLIEAPLEPQNDVPEGWQREINEVFATQKTRFIGEDLANSALVEWLAPPIALLLFGAGPDVPPLVQLARDLGHEITIIDRRPDFAVPEEFPNAQRIIAAKPHQVASHLKPDSRTVAVIMNHHYDTDRDVLAALLPLGLPYLAVLGPRRRTECILAELAEAGLVPSPSVLESIHAPAGLDLGSESPEQIALSILAEIQATLTGRQGGKLKFRNAPIHGDTLAPSNYACAVPG